MAELTGNEPVSTGNLKALMDWTAQGRDISVSNGSVSMTSGKVKLDYVATSDFVAYNNSGVKCLRAGIYEVDVKGYAGSSSSNGTMVSYQLGGSKAGKLVICAVAMSTNNSAIGFGSDSRLVELDVNDTIAFSSETNSSLVDFNVFFTLTRLYAR